ncbi:hypothetical protein [Terribacillus sp. DMT04]|uniref:hypothetical protein n=1 Tax=Terribacillus sp. DMT04 TaxID=2850441 RepID=UPI001C2CC217|nr:hypothetical protein [Terribacillus sp. DMT04]QXE01969.1 hypothetical protein KS242_01565 [Terribacillus sp. DMT04]
MKKYALFFTTLTLICMVSGCSKEFEDTVRKANQATKAYIENDYEHVKTIELDNPFQSPMGGMSIDGTVNDGMAGFSISFNKDISISSISTDKGFPSRK